MSLLVSDITEGVLLFEPISRPIMPLRVGCWNPPGERWCNSSAVRFCPKRADLRYRMNSAYSRV